MNVKKMMVFRVDNVFLRRITGLLIQLLCLLFMNLPGKSAQAAPAIIHDNGHTQPIETLIPALKPELPKQLNIPPPQGDQGEAFISRLFPLRSQTLSPGIVKAREVTLNVNQPFFLVGHDESSFRWLANFCSRLKEIQASGLVVAADSVAQFKAMTATCPGLPMAPVNGDGLAKELDLHHYPVLISGRRIEQ